jgi:hypothetical protein
VVAPHEGTNPNFNEAFTQLHLGQLLALEKCTSGDRRDGRINPNTVYIILRRTLSTRPCVDEGLGNASSHDVVYVLLFSSSSLALLPLSEKKL